MERKYKSTLAKIIAQKQEEERTLHPKVPAHDLLAENGMSKSEFNNLKGGQKSIKNLPPAKLKFLADFYEVKVVELLYDDPEFQKWAENEGLEHYVEFKSN